MTRAPRRPPARPSRNPYVRALARVMKVQREGLFISQAAAAASILMPQPHWCRIESGRQKDVAISTFVGIAAALRFRAADLMALVESEIRSRPSEYTA